MKAQVLLEMMNYDEALKTLSELSSEESNALKAKVEQAKKDHAK